MIKTKGITIPKNASFLILDESEQMRVSIKSHLRHFGFTGKIIESESPTDTLILLKEHEIDFVFSEWEFNKGLSGHDLLKSIRLSKEFSGIPFLMVTKKAGVSDMMLANKSGASGYLVKPWKRQELLENIFYAWANEKDRN
jgi:DNA-binding response OmpR family regulator